MAEPARKVTSIAGHEFGYPHGHLGHLNVDEEDALRNFKLFLQEKGLYTPGNPASHDDPTLLYVLSVTCNRDTIQLLTPPSRSPTVGGSSGLADG